MRACKKNQTLCWVSNTISEVDEVDSDGYFTGNKLITHTNVEPVYLNLYPSDGHISNEIFGLSDSFDFMITTIKNPFNENSVFYLTEPIDTDNFDFKISSIKESLNSTYYALKKVTK